MRPLAELFDLTQQRGYWVVQFSRQSDARSPLLAQLGQHSIRASWVPFELTWFKRSPGTKAATITRFLDAVCVPEARLPHLQLRANDLVELLPVVVEGERWTLVHGFYRMCGFDMCSSTIRQPDPQGPITYFEWINTDDTRLLDVEIACARPQGGMVIVTDTFVKKVRAAGLVGLTFSPCGFVVSDYSAAVPRRRAKPRTKGTSGMSALPIASIHPLPVSDARLLEAAGRHLRLRLHLGSNATIEATLAALLTECANPDSTTAAGDAVGSSERAMALAAVFGDLVCRTRGWSWVELRVEPDGRWPAVAPPAGTHALAVVPFIHKQLSSDAPTLRLLFNLIAAGQLPPAIDGTVVTLG